MWEAPRTPLLQRPSDEPRLSPTVSRPASSHWATGVRITSMSWQNCIASLSLSLAVTVWAQRPEGSVPVLVMQPDGVQTASGQVQDPSGPSLMTKFRGRRLSYVEIDGWAVHGGDMVLGRAEDMEPFPRRNGIWEKSDMARWARRELSAKSTHYLWPDGIIPYVIDADVTGEQQENIVSAIQEWNNKTVIRIVQRQAQSDYVRFKNVAGKYCRSDIGMRGGEQFIYIPPIGCSADSVVHEIGHTVGLWHEHQREDRDEYVTVYYENLDQRKHDQYSREHPPNGPYDYASAMHYARRSASSSNGGDLIETVPPGMMIPSGSLSAGDINGVAKLYGHLPEVTTITTNPPGLAVVVDGVRVHTPATVRWSTGTTHILEAPVSQMLNGTRYLFGRWNDVGQRLHDVTASPDVTWLEANFIVQYYVETAVEPRGVGSVTLSPTSPDGFYTLGTHIQAEAIASSVSSGRYRFLRWKWDSVPWNHYGWSSSPALWKVDRPNHTFSAEFSTSPFLRVESNIDPFVLRIRGYYQDEDTWVYAPAAFRTDVGRTEIGLGIDEVQRAPKGGSIRYRFQGWSNGGAASHFVDLPQKSAVLKAQFKSEFLLSTSVSNASAGRITVSPAADGGYYREGTGVNLTAWPTQSWQFVGWTGDIHGRDSSTTIEMERPTHVEAVFSQTSEVRPDDPVPVSLPATNYRFRVYDRQSGFRVEPPPDASEIRISYESARPDVDVRLFVQTGSEQFRWSYGPDGITPEFSADYGSWSSRGAQTVVINANSDPPLDPSETYYAALVVFSPRTRIEGIVRTEIDRGLAPSPSARVNPQALTFVSPSDMNPAAQVVRLTNTGTSSFHYFVGFDGEWLSTNPASGILDSGSTSEINVKALTAKISVETHVNRLTIGAFTSAENYVEPVATVPITFVVFGKPSTYVIEGSVSSPMLLKKVEPKYSESARRAKIQGTVILAIEIWEDGRAHNIRVIKSLGYGLDEEAIKAVAQWTFKPGAKDGRAVRVAAQVEVSFRLI